MFQGHQNLYFLGQFFTDRVSQCKLVLSDQTKHGSVTLTKALEQRGQERRDLRQEPWLRLEIECPHF